MGYVDKVDNSGAKAAAYEQDQEFKKDGLQHQLNVLDELLGDLRDGIQMMTKDLAPVLGEPSEGVSPDGPQDVGRTQAPMVEYVQQLQKSTRRILNQVRDIRDNLAI